MFQRHLHRRYLLALAAIVLLLQSFAVWHDAEHAFHVAESQCERLDAINHLPLADLSPELVVVIKTDAIEIDPSVYNFQLPAVYRHQHAIRAPPVFS